MIFLLLLYYLSIQQSTQAIPVPSSTPEPALSSSTNVNRSLFSIILSCVTTTIICAWVSVHPNVPPRDKLSAFSRRVWLMFWTIIAPELVLAWAVRQRYAARMVHREFKDHRWTETHGHFLVMGGFTLINGKIDDEPEKPEQPHWFSRNDEDYDSKRQQYDREYRRYNLGPVSFEDFKKLVDDSEIDFPTITTAEIEDRSKGDFLSKALAVIQTTWFLLQCAARIPQRLALTELELVTLALASLNAVTYFFWWNKPLQVQEPVKLFLKKTRDQVDERDVVDSRHDVLVGEVVAEIRVRIKEFGELIWSFLTKPCDEGILIAFVGVFFIPLGFIWLCFHLFPLAIVGLLNVLSIDDTPSASQPHRIAGQILGRLRLKLITLIHTFFQDRFNKPGGGQVITLLILFPSLFFILLALIPFLFLFFLVVPYLFYAVFNIITTDTIPPGARHIPSFYAPKTTSDRYSRMIVFAFFGVIFGGLHVVGWFFEFPTPFERTLWCVTAITITGIPLIVAPIDFLIARDVSSSWIPRTFLVFVMTILLCMYVPARLSLIAQAIALLRHQPPSAYASVRWAKYIPHILSS